MPDTVTNVVIAGLGGQGVLKASSILAEAAFRAGLDVKCSEIHGMSQRGGSVSTDIRFGDEVLSPMVPTGEADFLVVLSADQVDNNRHCLHEGGTLITVDAMDENALPNKRSINVALLGVLSAHLDIPREHWLGAVAASFPAALQDANEKAFLIGHAAAKK